MRRHVLVPTLLAILCAALPACDFDVGPGAGTLPPDANLCASWQPSPSACDEERCMNLGDCGMESCDPATGETRVIACARPVSPPAPIAGDWSLHAHLSSDDPCPEVTRVDELLLTVVPDGSGAGGTTCSILDRDGHLLATGELSEGSGATEVRFTLQPTWTGSAGAEVPAQVDYHVTVYTMGGIVGDATATATSGDTTCTYAFAVEGTRS